VNRKVFGLVLLGLGAFLLVAAVVATTWAPGVVKKTPLDVDQVTRLEGTVQKFDAAAGALSDVQPVKVQSISGVDSKASDDDDAVWVQTSCVVIDVDDPADCVDENDPRLVSADDDVFATDRVSALAANDAQGLPDTAVPHEGLINKWPFDSEKKDYPFWDSLLGRAVPAVYDRTATLAGIDCYVYLVDILDEPAEVTAGLQGTYTNHIEIWVEPKTGAIQQQTQDQQRYLDDGTEVLDLSIGFTDGQIDAFADDARDNMRLLSLLTFWVPVVGFVGGGLSLLAGLALLLTAGRRPTETGADRREPAGAGV
jgi:hypothetical protein